MRGRIALRTVVALAALALLAVPPAAAQTHGLRKVRLAGPGYQQMGPHGRMILHPREAVADRLLVGLDPGMRVNQVAPLAAGGGGRVRRLLAASALLIVDLPEGSDLEAAAARYQALPGVRFAVPDTLVYPSLVPNDPLYDRQYHLPLCRAPEAWDAETGSSSVIIADVDSGVDLNHPDLAAKIWVNADETPGNGLDDDGNSFVDDVNGWNFLENNNNVQPVPVQGAANDIVAHGTLTSGTAAAVGNEGYGAAGIDWHAKIMPLKVFGHDGEGTITAVVEAIDYAVANGAKVINLSLGGSYNTAFTPPIERAYQAGVVVVCAGGNSARGLGDSSGSWESPVCNDGPQPLLTNYVIGVGATDRNDRKAYYSNWDTSTPKHFIDISAPGDAIYGPVFQDAAWPQFQEYHGTNSGTSFSCPVVAGLAALLLAHFPGSSPDTITQMIRQGADNIDDVNPGYLGQLGGRANFARSLGVISPPLPVRDLAAADTPGDQGGSVAVTWQRSGDDGAGANNVTRYTVRRREGPGGAWTDRVELPPGSAFHDDATTDGLDYYYMVRTFAGTLYTDSSVVGPVQSRNDSPPPAIADLTAQDRPGDGGSAILLGWSYSPPADFSEFRVYRDSFRFTSVAGRTPLTVLRDASARAYTDTTVTDGLDYYYAVTAVDVLGNENKAVLAAGPVQSFTNQDVTLPAGLQLIATPAVPADRHPATLLGLLPAELVCARYDAALPDYVRYAGEPLPDYLRLALGTGLWVDLPRAVTISPSGSSAPAGDYPVPVGVGWQMLGNPFFTTFDFAGCSVLKDGTIYDLPAAEVAGLVRAVAWIYDRDLLTYRMLSADLTGSRLVAPWRGFWFKGFQTCTLNLARPLGATSAAAVRPLATRASATEGWALQLTAEAGPCHDVDNYVGVAAAAREVEGPPPLARGVDLALGDGSGAAVLAARVRALGVRSWQDTLTVRWTGVSGTVRLAWPQVNSLPRPWRFLLTDLATGQTVSLRAVPGYSFTAPEAAGVRTFRLTVDQGSSASLAVTSLAALATGRGAEVVFVLSQPASCDIKVLNIAGRAVRQVLSGALRPAGQSIVPWDGRSDQGTRVPAGRYLVEFTAREENGTAVRLLRPLLMSP